MATSSIGRQLLSVRGITTALQLRLGGVMPLHIAIKQPNCIAGIQTTYELCADCSAQKQETASKRATYFGIIWNLTDFKATPIIQDVPPTLSLGDGLFVMLTAVFEAKGSHAFRASPSSGCRNGSEGTRLVRLRPDDFGMIPEGVSHTA